MLHSMHGAARKREEACAMVVALHENPSNLAELLLEPPPRDLLQCKCAVTSDVNFYRTAQLKYVERRTVLASSGDQFSCFYTIQYSAKGVVSTKKTSVICDPDLDGGNVEEVFDLPKKNFPLEHAQYETFVKEAKKTVSENGVKSFVHMCLMHFCQIWILGIFYKNPAVTIAFYHH